MHETSLQFCKMMKNFVSKAGLCTSPSQMHCYSCHILCACHILECSTYIIYSDRCNYILIIMLNVDIVTCYQSNGI